MNKKDILRTKAEEILSKRGKVDLKEYSLNLEALVEELQIYQIELEYQNDELRRIQNELEQSEKNFKDLFENSPNPYVIINEDFTIEKANKTFLKLLDIDSIEPKVTKFTFFISPDSQDDFYLHHRNILKTKKTQYTELKLKHNFKTIFVKILSEIESVFSDKKAIRSSFTDISIEKNLLDELQKAKFEAEKANNLKSAFLANTSHEIRTPLNGIIGFTDILHNMIEDKKALEFLSIIKSSGHQLLMIISDIIDLSKIDSGYVTIDNSEIDLNDVIDDVVFFYKESRIFKNKDNITITPVKEKEDIKILVDNSKLRQILDNLITNSIKHTKKGSILVGYNVIDNENIEIFVKDTGKGMPEDKIDTIFNRFVKLDNTEGTGLGLSIVKKLCELMNAQISVKSKIDDGTCVTLRIPTKVELANSKEIEKEENKLDDKILIGKKILIAEDDYFSQILFKEFFEMINVDVKVVNNGKKAVDLVENEKFDVIILDIEMPIMTGIEAMEKIREIGIKTPIIAQTAYAMTIEREQCLSLGADDYITKPIDRDELLEMIKRLLVENKD